MNTFAVAAASWLAYTVLIVLIEMLGQHSVSRALNIAQRWATTRRVRRRAVALERGEVEKTLAAFYRHTPVRVGLEALPYRPDAPIYSPPSWRSSTGVVLDGKACLIIVDRRAHECRLP